MARIRSPTAISPAGASAARRCIISRNFPRYLPTDFKIKSEHNRGHDWPIAYDDVAPFYDKVAADIGVSGDAKAEEKWRPAGKALSDAADEDVPGRRSLAQGRRGQRHPSDPDAVGMNSTEFKGRPACIYDGWCQSAVRSARSPIRW